MTLALANGININYEQTGSGPPMVLIHGLTGSLQVWKPFIVPALIDTFTVLTMDLRGHGQSDMPASGYTSADMAADLVALLDERGIERAHVVGHSLGGVVALHMTALHPGRVSALSVSECRVRDIQPSQKVKDWPHWEMWKAQLEAKGQTVDGEAELDFTLLASLAPKPAPVAEGEGKPAGRRMDRWEKLLSETTAAVDLKDSAGLTTELIGALRLPVQALYAELSFCLPTLERLRELLPSLKATVLPGVGHLYPLMRPALFSTPVKAFHAGVEAPATIDPVIEVVEPPSTDQASDSPPQ